MADKKLVKVTFEYEDGQIDWLEGEHANNWYDAANSMAVMESVHGRPFPQFEWKSKKKNLVIKNSAMHFGKQLKKSLRLNSHE